MSIFGIGISGMNVAQAGLVTTGHNISNASTPGYSRQEVIQSSVDPRYTGAGFIGQGVAVTTVRRLYNEVLSNQLSLAQSQGGMFEAYSAQVDRIANLLADPASGLSPRLQEFFGALADVASHPQSLPSRQTLLSSADALVASFQGLDQQLEEIRDGLNSGIRGSVDAVNSYARQIAGLNHSIVVAESANGLMPANDLRDQRDQLIASLNQEVRASVVRQEDGSYNVFVGNGQPLVLGVQVFGLVARPSAYDAQRLEVGLSSAGSVVALADDSLQGGTLGGLLNFRSQSLDGVQNELGRVAIALAQSFNDQHALGQDLNGNLGGAFFSLAGPQALASANNNGTASLTASLQQADALSASGYKLLALASAGGNDNFVLTRLSDGASQSYAVPAAGGYPFSFSMDGLAFTLGAGARAQDSWMIEPTRQGASGIGLAIADPARIAAAAPVRTAQAPGNSGSASISAGSIDSVAQLPLAGPVTLTFDAALGQFSVAGALPAVAAFAYQDGATIDINGVNFAISGAPADGDQFTLAPNSQGVSDNRNALALGGLQAQNTIGRDAASATSQANASYQGAYAMLVSRVGNQARQMEVSALAQRTSVEQTRQAQQSFSGVNLDEEAANLLRYQQIYQASGKMMQIADSLFDTVLSLGR
jgi:flagellar hook-associated protein 1 FlgK